MKKPISIVGLLVFSASPAFAHFGHGSTGSFAAGLAHPFGGLDHVAVMVMVGSWAALKGGRARWAWPLAFINMMLIGGALGMTHIPVPFVEPGIFASVVTLGLLVALAVDLPVASGAASIAVFAIFHGHAHGNEAAESVNAAEYMAGFALATATLHLVGIGFAQTMTYFALRPAIRIAGALCVLIGAGWFGSIL